MDKNKTRVKANDGDDKVRRSRQKARLRVLPRSYRPCRLQGRRAS